jgi:hypothetical protein
MDRTNNSISFHVVTRVTFLIALLTCFAGCSDDSPSGGTTPVDLASLVPKDNDISGWTRDGALKEFNSIDDLYDEIDGEAQLYGDYGFRESVVQPFKGPGEVSLILVISDQTDGEGASGLYEEIGDGTEQELSDLGIEGRNSLNPIVEIFFVEFWRDKYYVTVEINSLSDTSQDVAVEFAKIVDDNILQI